MITQTLALSYLSLAIRGCPRCWEVTLHMGDLFAAFKETRVGQGTRLALATGQLVRLKLTDMPLWEIWG